MVTKFCCGETIIRANKFHVDPPPVEGGIGHVIVTDLCESIWTGSTHLWLSKGSEVSIHISNITSVETRSNMWESEELWKPHFIRIAGKFTYEYEQNLTEIIEKLSIL